MRKVVKKLVLAGTFAAASAFMVSDASASLITGTIGFGGSAQPVDDMGNGLPSFIGAVGIDVLGNDDPTANNVSVLFGSTSGVLANISFGSVGRFEDFNYDDMGVSLPVDPLWTVTDGDYSFSFTLESVTNEDNPPMADFINLSGTGTLSGTFMGTPFEDTFANWSFSGNTTQDMQFVFSADNSVPVPVPGTLALLGAGLAAMGWVGRRRT